MEIGTLTVNGYDGKVTIGQDVANFNSDNLVDVDVTGDDLVTLQQRVLLILTQQQLIQLVLQFY